MLTYEKFAMEFAKLKKELKSIIKDDDLLTKIISKIHEFSRKYAQFAITLQETLMQINNWSIMKHKYRATDDLEVKLELLENFIYCSNICANNECPIFTPLEKLNLSIEFLEYTSLKEAKKAYGENTAKFEIYKKEYKRILTNLNKVMKVAYQLYVTNNTKRYEKQHDKELLRNLLLFAKESKEKGMININNVAPFENVFQEIFNSIFKKEKQNLTKADEREKYLEVGKENIERIKKELGENLELIRRDEV
ncbi:MAG: hypothetical protein ACP6IY_18795 [Promethearchaeia archaeon]